MYTVLQKEQDMKNINLLLLIIAVLTAVSLVACGRGHSPISAPSPAITDQNQGNLSQPEQPRNSTFSGAVRFTLNQSVSATFPGAVAAGDFNSDGNADYAFGQIGAMSFCFGDGQGRFTELVEVSFDEPGDGIGVPTVMKSGDYNNDGRVDLAVAYPMCTADNRADDYPQSIDKHNLWIYWGGSNVASNPTRLRSVRYLSDIAFLRLNDDNLMDIMVVGNNGSSLVHYQSLDRQFIEGERSLMPYYIKSNPDYSNVIAGDLCNEGKDAFIVSNTTDDVVSYSFIYDQYTNGFNSPLGFWLDMPYRGQGLNLLDANNDGTLDLILGSSSQDGLAIAYGIPMKIGTKSFWKASDFQILSFYGQGHSTIGNVNQACSADFDSDGVLELAVADLNNISILRFNDRTPSAEVIGQITYPSRQQTGVGMLATADFNRDGKPDLVTTDIVGGRVMCLLNASN